MTITAHIISDPDHSGRWCVQVGHPDLPAEPIERSFSTPGFAVDAIVGWAAQRGITFLYSFSLSIDAPSVTAPFSGGEGTDR